MKYNNFFLDKRYAELYLKENEELFEFRYSMGEYFFYNLAIKSPIPNTDYFDLSSPYGYSGYYINTNNGAFIKTAIKEYEKRVTQENIIAEFIRFHPLTCNVELFQPFVNFLSQGKPIIVTETNYEKRWHSYGSKERNKMRKALRDFSINQSFDYEQFYHLYNETMKKREASTFYFFSKEYFKKLVNMDNVIMLEAKFEETLHTMSIFLYDTHSSYYHLTANSSNNIAYHGGATRAVLETFFQIAEKLKIQNCILGGGLTDDFNDTLFQFKKQFSPIIKYFFVGGKIYNSDVYSKLIHGKKNSFFLAYRFD